LPVLIEKTVTENIIIHSPMKIPEAVLYGICSDGRTFVLGSNSDVYSLLENDYSDHQELIGIAVQATGWAAPLNPETGETDGPPSQHPERRRVVLVATITSYGFCSALKFATQRTGLVIEETEFEEEHPSGVLWDALNKCFEKMKPIKNREICS
jgi:hypothetical protein